MAIKTIENFKAKDEGFSDFVVCPKCEKYIAMRLFYLDDKSKVSLLKGENTSQLIAVCPCCAGVFSVSDHYCEEKKKGTTVYMTESDLKEIRNA